MLLLYCILYAATAAPLSPFSTSRVQMAQIVHPLKPTALWDSSLLSKPKPTGEWWQNAVLKDGEQTIVPLPYFVQLRSYGLDFCYVGNSMVNTPEYVLASFRSAFYFSANGATLGKGRVVAFDSLTMTYEYPVGSGNINIPFARGSPYLTAIYSSTAPCLQTINAIISVNGLSASPVTGSSFTISLNNGERWVLYTSSPQTWTWNINQFCTTHKSANFVLRVAYVADSASLAVLNAHSNTFAVGGHVDIDVQSTSAVVHFDYSVRSWSLSPPFQGPAAKLASMKGDQHFSARSTVWSNSSGAGGLLLMSLPHHAATLQNPILPGLTFKVIVGTMRAIEGTTWSFHIPLAQMSWDAPRPIDADKVADVKAALLRDVANISIDQEDPYFWGKQMSRVARLALIANSLGDTASREKCLNVLIDEFEPWIKGSNEDTIQYDTTWNGVVCKDGVSDAGADFGAGYYNDHHYHWGYHLYAAAVVARFRASWINTTTIDHFKALARDIANPSPQDPYFPQFRHFDWFEGHSWASGLFEFGDGKNQESSSEAVNAWYALQLYGDSINDLNMENTGRLLLSLELHGSRTYFHMSNAEGSVYDPPYSNGKCVGILWNCKSVYSTWFASGAVYIHGIQMLPFVPVSELLLTKGWMREDYPVIEADMTGRVYPIGWVGYMFMAHAVIDKDAAWSEVKSLSDFDDGNSATNALWWVATRPETRHTA